MQVPEEPETAIVIKYNIPEADYSQLIGVYDAYNYQEYINAEKIAIDGVEYLPPFSTSSHNFTAAGEHVVKYYLTNNTVSNQLWGVSGMSLDSFSQLYYQYKNIKSITYPKDVLFSYGPFRWGSSYDIPDSSYAYETFFKGTKEEWSAKFNNDISFYFPTSWIKDGTVHCSDGDYVFP